MKDLLVQSRFRNNILWQLMAGRTASEVSLEVGCSPSKFGAFLNLKSSPFKVQRGTSTREYVTAALKIAAHFKVLPEDLFPASLYALELPDVVNREYESREVSLALASGQPSLLPSPVTEAENKELRGALEKVLHSLTPREERIMRLRWGLEDGQEYTLEEVAQAFRITRERARQVESRAFRTLRHPSRLRKLSLFLSTNIAEARVSRELDREREQKEQEAEDLSELESELQYRETHNGWASNVILEGE
jgi:RNA polymerase sigma factor (sigma-70 family)